MRMILFTFITTPEPQMFDMYLDRLKDELEMFLYEVILQDNNIARTHVNQLKIRVEEGIPELEASFHTTVRNKGQSFQTSLPTLSGT